MIDSHSLVCESGRHLQEPSPLNTQLHGGERECQQNSTNQHESPNTRPMTGQKLNWTVEVFLMSDYEAHVSEVIKQVPEADPEKVAEAFARYEKDFLIPPEDAMPIMSKL